MFDLRMVSLPDMHLVVRLHPDEETGALVKAFNDEKRARDFITQEKRTQKLMGLSARETSVLALLKRTKKHMRIAEIVSALKIQRHNLVRDLESLVDLGFTQSARKGKLLYYFVEGAKEEIEKKRARAPKTAPTIRPETQAPKPVNEGMERPQATQDLIDEFLKNGGEVRRVERGASGEFYNVRMWLESIGVDFRHLGMRKGYKVNGKKMTEAQVLDLYDEERKKRGLEPLRVGGPA
tara:strand:+ start:194 stop:904 length:711 start_codon:yes stop_codon:yes gene_type:complete